MPFTIPDSAAAWNAAQARIQTGDLQIMTDATSGVGIVSGAAVTAQGSPNMTVAVASGTVRIGGASVMVTSGNVTITANSSGNPRIDLICVNASGTKSAQAGATAATPKYPAIPASSVVLAAVLVPTGASSITSSNIVDKRAFVASTTGLVAANNLSDVSSASTSRTNLGLGGAAVLSVGTTAGTVAAGDDSRFWVVISTPYIKTATYTLDAPDGGLTILMNVATANTLYVPTHAAKDIAYYSFIQIIQIGAGTTTITAVTPGTTSIRSRGNLSSLAGQYAVATLYKADTDIWYLTGDLS